MVDAVVRLFAVSLGWVFGVVAGGVALLLVVVGAVWFLTRPPSAESEVRAFLSARGLENRVSVEDCRPVQADSTFDRYRCSLDVTGRVQVDAGDGSAATLSSGTYCFNVPRSGSDSDREAELLGTAC